MWTCHKWNHKYILTLPTDEAIKSRQEDVHRKLYYSSMRTRATVRTSARERSDQFPRLPGLYTPSRQLRYLKRRIASLVRLGNPASRRRYIQSRAPAQALPPGPVLGQARQYHVLFLPRLPTSTWILGMSTTTPNLSVYVDLRIVQANLSLPQRSN